MCNSLFFETATVHVFGYLSKVTIIQNNCSDLFRRDRNKSRTSLRVPKMIRSPILDTYKLAYEH